MSGLDNLACRVEATIARCVVQSLLAEGYALSVDDGEEITVRKSRDAREILDAMATTDSDTLRAYPNGETVRAGSVMLIYGNGEDVISDWSWTRTAHGEAFNTFMETVAAQR